MLLVALWVAVTLIALTSLCLEMRRGGITLGRGLSARLQALDLAREGVLEAELRLRIADRDLGWAPDGRPHRLRRDGGVLEVVVEDEGQKANVNRLGKAELRQLLEERLGMDPERADALSDAILDWRDPDDLHRPRGAERDYYEALEPPYRPTNGPLRDLHELLLVRGVDPALYYGAPGSPGLAEVLTVYRAPRGQGLREGGVYRVVCRARVGEARSEVEAYLRYRDGTFTALYWREG